MTPNSTGANPIHILSLGAGVQSSTLALMAAAGEVGPMPVSAVFADTGDEPSTVYRWLDWLETQLPFPVVRHSRGESLSANVFSAIETGARVSNPPLFTLPDKEWRRLRDEEPEAWNRAIEFDAKIRTGIHKVRAKCFVHRDCVPLAEVDLSTDDERGQGLLWGNECEGMCGV